MKLCKAFRRLTRGASSSKDDPGGAARGAQQAAPNPPGITPPLRPAAQCADASVNATERVNANAPDDGNELSDSISDISATGHFAVDAAAAGDAAVAAARAPAAVPGGCPFMHGSIYADPYPGYVHGNPKRGICPNGCRPETTANITAGESPKETLLRESMEYISLYYHERADVMKGTPGFLSREERMDEIRESIEATGTYEHTFDELQHGSRVAWRNAPKCSNRKYWQQLKLLDARDVTTNKGMFDCCIRHLAKAMECGSSEAYITVFKPKHPGGDVDGPRIWNDQLLQYAAYRKENGEVIGDPKNLRFTEMLKERFGWKGPFDGKKSAHDYLPLVVQAAPNQKPELFDVPLEAAPPVVIHHPEYPELSSLDMKWYPIPAVCALDMTLGGITYTAVPFNGWYANTEVLRDLTDSSRYNMLVPVATALGMDANTKPGEAPLWIDDVMSILSKAVYHSFKTAKIAMIDHHNLINMFWDWFHDELRSRKYCPVNWKVLCSSNDSFLTILDSILTKIVVAISNISLYCPVNYKWVIPPMSSSTSEAYLGLSKAQEYTLKPAYIVGKGFIALEEGHFGRRDTSKAMKKLLHTIYLALLFKRAITRFRSRKLSALIIYASVTGNASKYASDLGAILNKGCNMSFFNACSANASQDEAIDASIRLAQLVIFVSSTQGNGEIPPLSQRFFSSLFGEKSHLLKDKKVAVLGFGSSAYPIFCGAGIYLSDQLAYLGATEVISLGKCDSVKGETSIFYNWTSKLVEAMAPECERMAKLHHEIKENNASSMVKHRDLLKSVQVQVFTADEVKTAAAESFMRRRGSADAAPTLDFGAVSANEEKADQRKALITKIVSCPSSDHRNSSKDVLVGQVIDRTDLISSKSSDASEEVATRKTSLVKISLDSCGNPPYNPGDHVKVYPRNIISRESLQSFAGHLSGSPSLEDHIYVTFENDNISRAELAVTLPLLTECDGLLIPLRYFFEEQVALLDPISMQACRELAAIASDGKDRSVLSDLGQDPQEYEKMTSLTGLKWIDLFRTFPSLSSSVSLAFLICNMKGNFPRSYSISSCKAVVGSELHLCVGRFVYTRGGSKMEAGVCSNFLTSLSAGDEVKLRIESAPSFHHPLDPACPIIFIATGTGFAPIRGLLQKRSYLKARGEKLGPTFLIFGSRSSKEGLFQDEIKQLSSEGVVTKVYHAYSREPGAPKEYTSDKLRSSRVRSLLGPLLAKANTHVFICGSASMAEQSKEVLAEISSQACLDAMQSSGRLHQDVFGALSSEKGGRLVRANSVRRRNSIETDAMLESVENEGSSHSNALDESFNSSFHSNRSTWTASSRRKPSSRAEAQLRNSMMKAGRQMASCHFNLDAVDLDESDV